MYYTKVKLYVDFLSEHQYDCLRTVGYTSQDSKHIWDKIYEIDSITDVNTLVLGFLEESNIAPYSIELNRSWLQDLSLVDSITNKYLENFKHFT